MYQEHHPRTKNLSDCFIHAPLVEVLTPMNCSKIVSEIVKYIVYQKQQIPYPYEHLKQIAVTSACNMSSSSLQSPISDVTTSRQRKTRIMEGRQNKQAVQSFEAFEMIFKNLELELQASSSNGVKEVVLVMGSTPMSPREVYRILLPSLHIGHCDRPNNCRQSLLQMIRCLAMSNDLNNILARPLAPTNTYVYVKMSKSEKTSDWFLPKDRYTLPSRGQQVVISMTRSASAPDVECSFLVHRDSDESVSAKKVHLVGALEELQMFDKCLSSDVNSCGTGTLWYQSRLVLKGFKS